MVASVTNESQSIDSGIGIDQRQPHPGRPRGRHGYAGFQGVDGRKHYHGGAQTETSKPNISAADRRVERQDVVRLLHALRQRRIDEINNPQEPKTERKINTPRLPSPVPTEHREEALLVLLNKIDNKHRAVRRLDGIGNMLDELRQPTVPMDSVTVTPAYCIDTNAQVEWVPNDQAVVADASASYKQNGFKPSQAKSLSSEDRELRRIVRSKMHRCKRCKNRFIERGIYERHLKERHYEDYVIYMARQEEEMEAQRQAELESIRVDEITSGGFIPSANEVDAAGFDVMPKEYVWTEFYSMKDVYGISITELFSRIPLPGEQFGGKLPRFDSYGGLVIPRRAYVKKVSPQCPFCDKRFRNEASLTNHICKKHEESKDYVQCNVCYKCLRSNEHLAVHDCSLEFICLECVPMRNLCTENRLMAHRLKFHRGAKSGFQCTDCSMKFLTPRKLRKHKKMVHVVAKPHKCYWCDEFFATDTQVALHERVHTGMSKFECSICDYRVNRYCKMGVHLRHEHGYVCSVCKSKMSDREELLSHVHEEHGGYVAIQKHHHYVESPRVWISFKGE